MDEDNREVKMLQELLLEDGELHGSGRQRSFKWKNTDEGEESENRGTEDVDGNVDEEETEEEWRRRRHEREMFLKKVTKLLCDRFKCDESVSGDGKIAKKG